ncbi:hypothetical protein EDD11_007333 [Mortierella claussenii]|nr:hypothetical protein EDD11_007333 [Mortierella claussenii]
MFPNHGSATPGLVAGAGSASGRRSSQSVRSQGMVIDDEEEDEEDDGEIKPDGLRGGRSGSASASARKQAVLILGIGSQEMDNGSSEVHKCLDCGKIYKHPNCLWKHRWLHSVYWKGATKFLLSKHQQVQLMEAAAILLGMDESRQGDKDPIVSLFSKQRGALANSVGSASYSTTSSSSDSPPTSLKSMSRSPPPQSERNLDPNQHLHHFQQHHSQQHHYNGIRITEAQNNDIQMLTALRNGHVAEVERRTSYSISSAVAVLSSPVAVKMEATGSSIAAVTSHSRPNSTKSAVQSTTTTPLSTSPTSTPILAVSSATRSPSYQPSKAQLITPPLSASSSTSSSLSSTPSSTLVLEDESVADQDEDISSFSHRNSVSSKPALSAPRMALSRGPSNGMDMDMDMDTDRDTKLDVEMNPKSMKSSKQRPQNQPMRQEQHSVY